MPSGTACALTPGSPVSSSRLSSFCHDDTLDSLRSRASFSMSRRRRARRPAPTTDQRSPEARLEAMVREPNPERKHRTFARILDDLDAKPEPEPEPWLDAARTL